MRISKSEEYGLRLVMRLAENGGQLTIRELAEQELLPETTVAKVVSRLRRSDLVRAERGRNGGYSLITTADHISIARVVEAFNDRIYGPGFCDRMSPGTGSCAHGSSCGLRPVWRGLTDVIADFLTGITVADVIAGVVPSSRGALPMAAGQKL